MRAPAGNLGIREYLEAWKRFEAEQPKQLCAGAPEPPNDAGKLTVFGALFGGAHTSGQEYLRLLERAADFLNASENEQLLREAQLLQSEPVTTWIN